MWAGVRAVIDAMVATIAALTATCIWADGATAAAACTWTTATFTTQMNGGVTKVGFER